MPARISSGGGASSIPEGVTPSEFANLFRLPPKEAADYMAGRGKLTPTFDWRDLWHDEHATQFTVSRLARLDLLKSVHDGIVASVAGDLSRRDFERDIKAVLIKAGWWGDKEVTDPVTGELVTTTFDPARLKLIHDTNIRMAHSAGRWERMERNKASHPYIRYITKRDERVRASHAALDGVTLPVDHAFWDTHYPPNGLRCRCRAMSMSQREYDAAQGKGWLKTEAPPVEYKSWVDKRTGKVRQVPVGIDPGFDYNVGKAAMRARNLDTLTNAKLAGAGDLFGGLPRQLLNRVKSELAPSDILKTKGLDPDLLGDVGAVKAAEYYIRQVRPGIIQEIADGGLSGSAALKHEMAEVAALRVAGLSIYEPAHITKVNEEFAAALATGDPDRHIPWHLAALKEELIYAQGVLRRLGHYLSLGEVARVVYRQMPTVEADTKMIDELVALGDKWPEVDSERIVNAVRDSANLFKR